LPTTKNPPRRSGKFPATPGGTRANHGSKWYAVDSPCGRSLSPLVLVPGARRGSEGPDNPASHGAESGFPPRLPRGWPSSGVGEARSPDLRHLRLTDRAAGCVFLNRGPRWHRCYFPRVSGAARELETYNRRNPAPCNTPDPGLPPGPWDIYPRRPAVNPPGFRID